MASQIGLPFQDQNFGVQQHKGASSVLGKMNVNKSQKKNGGLIGRKPLGEISNSTNIVPSQASKKSTVSSKISAISQTRSRNALSDISNSSKAHLNDAIKNKPALKMSTVDEENLFPDCIADEMFLHDHTKCIKAQNNPMDVEDFLALVGLTNAPAKQVESPRPLKLSVMKPENHSFDLELLEISEDDYFKEQKLSSPICWTPKSPTFESTYWGDDTINFKLMD